MGAQLLQYLFSGLTVGSAYALAAIGFTLIYNASRVINFAQGEFIMLGGVLAAYLVHTGVPMLLAWVAALLAPAFIGMLIEKLAIEPVRTEEPVPLIIVTIGVSLLLRGLIQIWLGTSTLTLPPLSGHQPINVLGATILPQSLWVLSVTASVAGALWLFFHRTLEGKAMLATAINRKAADMVGIDTRRILLLSYGLSGALGALGGLLITPISMTSYDVGIMLGLKGFAGAIVGGLGSPMGAIIGGLIVGLVEALGAGYVSSAYKDVFPFALILLFLFFRPQGLLGGKSTERV